MLAPKATISAIATLDEIVGTPQPDLNTDYPTKTVPFILWSSR